MSNQLSHAVRQAGTKASLVLEELAARRMRTLTVQTDKDWLSEITPHYPRLLSRMEDAKLLYRIQRGRYVVAPRGTFSPAQAASSELLAARILAPHGDYFISHLTALIAHRLTDLHSSETYATVRQSSNYRAAKVVLPLGTLRIVRIADSRWPIRHDGSREIIEVRALPDTIEFFWRASPERALVDALARPDLCAGFETVVGCWVNAKNADTDWGGVCEIARRQGPSMMRRVIFLLRLIGFDAVGQRAFPDLRGRGLSTLLDRSSSFQLPERGRVRDRTTGIVVNVPPEYLLAWTGATSLM